MINGKNVIVALDAMGGDFAPAEQVKGAVQALEAEDGIEVKLYGDESAVTRELNKYSYDKNRISVVHCTEIVDNCDVPTDAIRKKKDSSMVKGLFALKNSEADAFVSCGNTGALLVGGQIITGRIRGIDRAALAFVVPSEKGPVLLMDCGANVDVRPQMLVQFAQMGSVYMESVVGIKSPRVGIVNIGEEETKGNQLVQETFPLMKTINGINFIGSIETRGMIRGEADVVVCDGFVGNIILKTYEGAADIILKVIKESMMSTFKSKMGALLVKKQLKESMQQFSIEEYGGAPMLGLKKFVVKTHGNSKASEIRNTIIQCKKAVSQDISGKITQAINK